MEILLISFLFVLTKTLILAIIIGNDNSEFAKFVLDVRNIYHARSVVVAMNDVYNYTVEARTALELTKIFSEHEILSNFITPKEFTEAMDYYGTKGVMPFYVVVIKTSRDYDDFVNITLLRKVNMYTSLVIFKTTNKTLMSMCIDPQRNYFNLVFDVKMFVVCQNEDLPVREWYSLHSDTTEINDFGTWTFETGIVRNSNKTLYERRKSLKGISLRVTSVKNETSESGMEGYFGSILEIIANGCNFSIDRQPLEEAYGVYNATTNKWNGILQRLVENDTDIGLGEFSITENRLKYIDFSEPIVVSYANYYVKQSNDKILQWTMYSKAFGLNAVYILVGVVTLVPFLTSFIVLQNNRTERNVRSRNFTEIIRECYFDILIIFCKMPLLNYPSTSSLSIAYFALYCFSFLLSSIYSAVLTSYLTIFKPGIPFYSIKEFMEDGSYRISAIKDTSFTEIFEESNDVSMNKLSKYLLDYEDLPVYVTIALDQACSDKKTVLFLDEYSVRSSLFNPSCELISFEQSHLINMAFAFAKGSPYVGFFNYYVQQMRAKGILQVLKFRNTRMINPYETNFEKITLDSTRFVFGIFILGVLLAIIFAICENLYFSGKKTKSKLPISNSNSYLSVDLLSNTEKKTNFIIKYENGRYIIVNNRVSL